MLNEVKKDNILLKDKIVELPKISINNQIITEIVSTRGYVKSESAAIYINLTHNLITNTVS